MVMPSPPPKISRIVTSFNCITYLGADGVLELNNDMSYHKNDSVDIHAPFSHMAIRYT